MSNGWWSLHSHSVFSANDAMPQVPAMVAKAVELGYPALGLTDHGKVDGAVQLYKACRKAGIEPFPGEEFYLTPDREQRVQSNYHITIASYSEQGYRNLVGLHNMAQRNFFYKPRIDLADIAGLAKEGRLQGLVASSGCFFGLVTQTLVHRGPEACSRLLAALAGWFPRFYVELHNHGVTHDDGVTTDRHLVDQLVVIADSLGIPYIIAQDSHYIEASEQDLHDSLKSLVSFSDDPSEAQFPGGPYSMYGYDDLVPLFDPVVLDRACTNLGDLAARAHLRLPELEEFTLRVPDVSRKGDPFGEIEETCWRVLGTDIPLQAPIKTYQERLTSDLEVLRKSGFADYLLLTAEVCAFMRTNDIWFQVRGSASGFLPNMLLGISELDPVAMDLRTDRFLSGDRLKPPDIDIDVEHLRRDEVVRYLGNRWTVRQIGSHMKYSVTDDTENLEEDSSKGSLVVKYYSTARKHGANITKWGQIPETDQAVLKELGSRKLIANSGTHAAGYLISPDEQAAAQVPLVWMASRKAFVTSFGMKDVEALGFVKLDLLGLRTMTAIKTTCDALGWTISDYRKIPLNDPDVMKRIRAGDTSAIFQLDGFSMTRGCKDLKPQDLEDLIAAQALFRPATRDSGATKDYLARRHKKESVPERHADIMAECKNTYGVLLYQEQVIGVLRRMGMPGDELTDVLGMVKASNEHSAGAAAALEQVKPRITELARARGWTEVDIAWLLDALVAYGEYSFNRAHAAAYGLTAYRTAYLAQHHPTEFWLGVIKAYEAHDREKQFIRAARTHAVKILPAHVNESGVSYSLDVKRNAVRRGLVSVKGIGAAIAAEIAKHQPYASLEDFTLRVNPSKVTGTYKLAAGAKPSECGGAIEALDDIGALDEL